MPQTVEVPSLGAVDFPDDYTPDQINEAVRSHMGNLLRQTIDPIRAEQYARGIAGIRELQRQQDLSLSPEQIEGSAAGVRPFMNPVKAVASNAIKLIIGGQKTVGIPTYQDPDKPILTPEQARNAVDFVVGGTPEAGSAGEGLREAATGLVSGITPADIPAMATGAPGGVGYATEMAQAAPEAAAQAGEAFGRGDIQAGTKASAEALFSGLSPVSIGAHIRAGTAPMPVEIPDYFGRQVPMTRGAVPPRGEPTPGEILRASPEERAATMEQMNQEATAGAGPFPRIPAPSRVVAEPQARMPLRKAAAPEVPAPEVPIEGLPRLGQEIIAKMEPVSATPEKGWGWNDFVDHVAQNGSENITLNEIRAMFPTVKMGREAARDLGKQAFGEQWEPGKGINAEAIRGNQGQLRAPGSAGETGEGDRGGNVEQTPPVGPEPVEPGGGNEAPGAPEVTPPPPPPAAPAPEAPKPPPPPPEPPPAAPEAPKPPEPPPVAPAPPEAPPTGISAIQAKLDQAAADALRRIQSRGGTYFGSGPLHELPNIADYAIYGSAKFAKVGLDVAKWSAEMIKDFGADIEKHLPAILNLVHKDLGQYEEFQKQLAPKEKQTPEQMVTAAYKAGKVTTNVSEAAGASVKTVKDLDELLAKHNEVLKKATDLAAQIKAEKDPKKRIQLLNKGMGNDHNPQYYREAIEAATDLMSNSNEMEVKRGKPAWDRPLDWTKNPEVADWIQKHGKELYPGNNYENLPEALKAKELADQPEDEAIPTLESETPKTLERERQANHDSIRELIRLGYDHDTIYKSSAAQAIGRKAVDKIIAEALKAKPTPPPQPTPKPSVKTASSLTQDTRIPQEIRDAHTNAVKANEAAQLRFTNLERELNSLHVEREKEAKHGKLSTWTARLTEFDAMERSLVQQWKQARADIEITQKAIDKTASKLYMARYQAETAPFRAPGYKAPEGTQKIDSATLKAQRTNLLGQIKEALTKAPEEGAEKIVMSVPGDGEWTVFNNKAALKKFHTIVDEEFPDSAARPSGPGLASPHGKVIPAAELKVPKKETETKVNTKIASLFVSEDEKRGAITQGYADGQQLVATDGRRLIRIVTPEAPGSISKPVRFNGKGAIEEKPKGNFPNFKQIISDNPDLVRGGVSTDQLWTVANQAKALWTNIGEREVPSVQLFLNPDGSIGGKSKRPSVGEFEHNMQPGAKGIGTYNPDYIFDAADASRRLGNDKVDLYFHGEEGPIEIRGKNSSVITMPLRLDEKNIGRDKGFVTGKAVHGRLPEGLGPLAHPESFLPGGSEEVAGGKFSADLEAGEFKVQKYNTGRKEWSELGNVSLAEWQKASKAEKTKLLADLISREFEGKPPQSAVNVIGKLMDGLVRQREKIIEEGKSRETGGVAADLKAFLDKQAAAALDRINKRGGRSTFGSGPLHEIPNIADYAIYGAAKLSKIGLDTAEKIAKWMAEMAREFPAMKAHLPAILDQSKKYLTQFQTDFAKKIKATSVQQIIEENTGVGPGQKAPESNVINALATGLRTARALKEHFTGGKKIPVAEVKEADAWLEGDATRIKESLTGLLQRELPPSERGAFITAINNATKRGPILTGDPETMYNKAAEVAARIMDRRQEVIRKGLVNKIGQMANRALNSPTVDVQYKGMIRQLLASMSMTKPTAATLKALQATRDFVAREEAAGHPVLVPKAILDGLELLNKVPIKELPIEAIQALHDKIALLEDLGRHKVQTRQAIWDSEKKQRMDELAGEVTNGWTKIPEIRGQPGDPTTLSQRWHNYVAKLGNSAKFLDKAILPIDAVMDLLGDAKATYRGWLFKHIRGPVDLGFNEAQVLRERLEAPVTELIKRYKFNKSDAEKLGIYAIAHEEGGVKRLVAMGVAPETIQKIVKEITPQQRAVYAEMRKAMDSTFPELQKLMRDLYNIDVQKIDNYFPLIRDHEAMIEAPELKELPEAGTSLTPDELSTLKQVLPDIMRAKRSKTEQGMTIERVKGARTPVKFNAFEVFHQHMNDVTYLLKMQRAIKMASEIARSDEFKGKYGDLGQKFIIDFVDTVARQGRMGPGSRIPWLDELRTRTSAGTVAFRPASQLVHASNVPLAIQRVGSLALYNKALAETFTDHGKQFLHDNFYETLARSGGEQAIAEAAGLEPGSQLLPGTYKKAVKAGFAVAREIDKRNAQATVLGVYMRELAKKGVKPQDYFRVPIDKEAQTFALVAARRAVASPLSKDVSQSLSRGALTGGNISAGRALFQFQNIFQDQWSNIRLDLMKAGLLENVAKPLARGQFKEISPRQAATMVAALTSMIVAETLIREGGRELISSIAGEKKKKKEDNVSAKVVAEVGRRFPFGGAATEALVYGQTGIPLLDAAAETLHAGYRAETAKKTKEADKQTIKALTGVAQLAGVPGASLIGELIQKSQ